MDFVNLREWVESKFSGVCVMADIHGNGDAFRKAMEYATAHDLFVLSLGDIIDYGDDTIECVDMMYDLVMAEKGMMLIGNHEDKYARIIAQLRKAEAEGKPRCFSSITVKPTHGTVKTFDATERLFIADRIAWEDRFLALMDVAHHHVNYGTFTFTHGAYHHSMDKFFGRIAGGKMKSLALYGETNGKTMINPLGKEVPIRTYNWVDIIPAERTVIVGHDIERTTDDGKPFVTTGQNGGSVIFLDTGCSKTLYNGNPGTHSIAVIRTGSTNAEIFQL